MEKKKKPFYKKWWVWVLAIIVLISFASAGGDDSTSTTSNEPKVTTKEETAKEEPKEEVKTEFAVGEQIQLGDNAVTVVKVDKTKGGEYDSPKSGHEYVIVTVEIENKGSENISYNPYDFKMSNSQGQVVDSTFTTIDSDTSLSSGELSAGGKVSGTIPFEMPIADPKLQLQYIPSFWSEDTIIINLQ